MLDPRSWERRESKNYDSCASCLVLVIFGEGTHRAIHLIPVFRKTLESLNLLMFHLILKRPILLKLLKIQPNQGYTT